MDILSDISDNSAFDIEHDAISQNVEQLMSDCRKNLETDSSAFSLFVDEPEDDLLADLENFEEIESDEENRTEDSTPIWKRHEAENFIAIKISNKGRELHHFLFDNYLYRIDKSTETTSYLSCISCTVRGKIFEGRFTQSKKTSSHNHENHKDRAAGEIAYNDMKEEVLKSRRNAREIHDEKLREIDPEVAAFVPWNTVSHTLGRLRRSKLPPVKNIHQLEDVLEHNEEVDKIFGKFRGENFYEGACGDEGKMLYVVVQNIYCN